MELSLIEAPLPLLIVPKSHYYYFLVENVYTLFPPGYSVTLNLSPLRLVALMTFLFDSVMNPKMLSPGSLRIFPDLKMSGNDFIINLSFRYKLVVDGWIAFVQ